MTAAILLGVAAGTGVLLLLSGLVPTRLPLQRALARLDEVPVRQTESSDPRWIAVLGAPLVDTSVGRVLTTSVRQDLEVLERSPQEHLARHLLLVTVALLWAPATFALMTIGGVDVSWTLPVWVSLVFGSVALVVPTLAVRAEAATRRRSFRHALGCFLDLVAVRLAGGAGVDSALAGSAAAGEGWAFAQLRRCLTEARLRGEPSWQGLASLGGEIGITELQELAASAGLAGDEGARVRISIAAKARAIRMRELADAEGAAQSASGCRSRSCCS